MKNLATFFLVLLSFPATAAFSSDWLKPVPPSAGTWREWDEIPQGAFFEVPASKLTAAEAWLADNPYLAQEQNSIDYFGRPDFKCVAPAKLYLVRALYINGGTGRFGLHWAGSSLVVSHASLGPGGPPSKSALVVCLAKVPTGVFSSLSGAL
jgi:hypothetical protein